MDVTGNVTVSLKSDLEELKVNANANYLVTNATFVCLMQCGFACLEAGSIRSKNVTNIMMKNILDLFISCLAFWIVGYAFAYGEGNSFIGLTFWAGINIPQTHFAHWFFQFMFAATAATLVSGAAAERCNFVAYLIYSALISGFIYPVAVHWVWSDQGWLNNLGYVDFAGSGPVHLLGGVCAGIAAILLGPRIGRFSGEHMPGHSIPLVGVGGMILITGFIAFNGGSLGTVSGSGAGAEISLVCINTLMAGTGGALFGLLASKLGFIKPKAWNFSFTLNSSLAGMVAVCATANNLSVWAALVLGITSGFVFFGFHFLIFYFKVDDPLDATSVHVGGGLWGVLSGPFFQSDGIIFRLNKKNLMKFLNNFLGALAIFTWSLITSLILFGLLKYFDLLRVSKEDELVGLDVSKHSEPAYPVEGWLPGKNSFNSSRAEENGTKNFDLPRMYSNDAFQVEHV